MLRPSTNRQRGILIACVFMLVVFSANAQHFTFGASTGTFTAVNGTAVAILSDDVISGNIPIGFTFNYYGTNYTELKASSNGYLTFNLASADDNTNVFNGTQTKLIAPLWDDLSGSGGAATYSTTGAVGSRVFTFEWINWRWNFNAGAAAISFQVKLYETTNVIQFVYRQEAGATNNAGASIGLIGNAANQFYSLANSTAAPTFSYTGVNNINTKPADNQVYTFNPGPLSAPTTPASQIVVSGNTGTAANLSWTNGNGAYRAVFMKNTATAEDITVPDATYISASSTFGTSGTVYSTDWYCVYNGTGNTVSVAGLEPGLSYRIKVVEYNGWGGAQKYSSATATNNPLALVSTLTRPTGFLSGVQAWRVSGSEVSLDITEGSGFRRLVFVKAGTTGTAPVVDNTTYTANTAFGSGSQIGNTGWYCVFNGKTSSGFIVTNLTGNTDYLAHVIDYNGPAGSELYATPGITPVTFKTFVQVPLPTYTYAASSGTFTPLVGGTTVPEINGGDFTDDDEFSAAIPVGFTFKFAGVPFTQLFASSNGFVTFNSIQKSSSASNDLTTSTVRPLIAPFWDDITGSYGSATYLTTGVAPNRVFTIEYLNWAASYTAPSAGLSFQIKLYETTNKVELVYRKDAGAVSNAFASIGLAFPNLGTGNFISLNGAGAAATASTTAETSNITVAPATGQIYSFTPVKMNQTVTFAALTDKFFGSGTFTLAATSTSGLPVTYNSSNTAVATIDGNVVTLTGVGSVTITASQPGDDVFNAAAEVPRAFIVNKGDQTISFSALTSKQFGSAAFNLTATASSTLPVSYSSSNTAVATVSGSTVTIVGVGTTDITASQPGNANYNAAANQVKTLTVTKANQVIAFTAFGSKTFGDAPFEVTASVPSGLPLTFTSANTAVATASGNVITIVGAGTSTFTISQAGNESYNSATYGFDLIVAKANQTITLPIIPTKTVGDAPFTLAATASSGLPVTFSVAGSSFDNTITINGNTVTVVGAGSASVHVSQAGNENYNPVIATSQPFCINPVKPTITVLNIDSEIPSLEGNATLTNEWFKDGVKVTNGQQLLVTTPGVYTLVTSQGQCKSVPSEPVSLVITGTEENPDAGLKIFPNPVMNELVVDLTALQEKAPVRVELYDAAGRTVHSEMASKTAIVKMEKQKPGLYLLRINGSKRVITKQIIKK